MAITKIDINAENNNNGIGIKKNDLRTAYYLANSQINDKVSFGSATSKMSEGFQNGVVKLMDWLDNGGFALNFVIADGLGFILPRVIGALFRGGAEKKDEDGNVILDKDGNPKHELNWAFARKEFIREVVTGPSALVIPWFMMKGIKKAFGTANNVKIDTIHSFSDLITDENLVTENGVDKTKFNNSIYEKLVGKDNAGKFVELQEKYSQKLLEMNKVSRSDAKKLSEEADNIIKEMKNEFIKIQKGNNPAGNVIGANLNGKSLGAIDAVPQIIEDYYNDLNSVIKKNEGKNIIDIVKKFKGTKSGTRFLTNIGVFGAVVLFFTQIPKLYNMGLKGNPALGNKNESENKNNQQNVSFSGGAGFLEKMSDAIQGNRVTKWFSDLLELDGSVISGRPMTLLLFSACIPPRLWNAQDKYDFGEILLRDVTAFSALLFGANILSRLFSDSMTKHTGLALNENQTKNENFFKKVMAYMSPSDGKHHVLSSGELIAKYTNIGDYKGEFAGFMEFIEKSGGNIKKAFAHDDNLKKLILDTVNKTCATEYKSYEDIPETEIKKLGTYSDASFKKSLDNIFSGYSEFADFINNSSAQEIKKELSRNKKIKDIIVNSLKDNDNYKNIKSFEEIPDAVFKDLGKIENEGLKQSLGGAFKGGNRLLRKARFSNSSFKALSTFLLVPSFIIWLTNACEKMTSKRIAQEKEAKLKQQLNSDKFTHS